MAARRSRCSCSSSRRRSARRRAGVGEAARGGERAGARRRAEEAPSARVTHPRGARPRADSAAVLACAWDPSRPFDRDAPAVKDAITHLDAGDAGGRRSMLEDYLSTGAARRGASASPIRCGVARRDVRPRARPLPGRRARSAGASATRRSTRGVSDDVAPEARRAQIECALEIAQTSRATRPRRSTCARARVTSRGTSTSSTATTRRRCAPTTRRSASRPAMSTAAIRSAATRRGTAPSRCAGSRTRRTPGHPTAPLATREDPTAAGEMPRGPTAVAAATRRPRRSPTPEAETTPATTPRSPRPRPPRRGPPSASEGDAG